MLKLKIPDMTCGHCAAVVTKAVEEVDASASVKIDLAKNMVMIGAAAESARIKEALERAGYPAEAV